jgi:hypothetical protein
MRLLARLALAFAIAAAPACGGSVAPAAAPSPANADGYMDVGLERLGANDPVGAASMFYGVYKALPETDVRRDLASFRLAKALVAAGLVHAGIEHYMTIVSTRHASELVNESLAELQPLEERHQIEPDRLAEDVLYGNQYSELSPAVGEFVEYLQAVTDIRHGFVPWGRARMEALAQKKGAYSFHARYALAVERIARHDDDAAAADLQAIIRGGPEVPAEVRGQSRLALARIQYERKLYDEAWRSYGGVGPFLAFDDVVILEKAWDLIGSGNHQRALGLLVGLGAPVFRDLFAPERGLIQALALRRLCQYRAAHLAVRAFRDEYGPVLAKIRNGSRLGDDPDLRKWAIRWDPVLSGTDRIQQALVREQAAVAKLSDKPLRSYLDGIYASRLARQKTTVARRLDRAEERVADELLRVDEQMHLVDYEVGVGLFSSGEAKTSSSVRPEDIPLGDHAVYFRFDGEYWSDEVGDYTVLAEDRCVR